jgi:L-asparaginase II
MENNTHIPLVEVTRGNIVESRHYGSLAVAQPDGEIAFSLGDITSPVFLRSSSKPFQALPFVESGGIERYGLTDREVAIICSSHSGTDEHVRVLEGLQKKIGIQESMLQCGIHAPFHAETAKAKLLKGEAYHSNQSDCAGKHSGMLAYAKMLNASLDNYIEPSHPVQQAMLKAFAQMCSIPVEDIRLGTDGCSVPVFAVPLANSAGAYARLCQPNDLPEERANACRLITKAMLANPDMIGGPQRFDTDIMTVGQGSLVSKVGAEGFYGIGVLPGKVPGRETSLGIAVKISDGDLTWRAGCVVVVELLKHVGVLSEKQVDGMIAYYRRPVYNWRNMEVGEIRPSKELIAALSNFHL